jgi:hypothetical protein
LEEKPESTIGGSFRQGFQSDYFWHESPSQKEDAF